MKAYVHANYVCVPRFAVFLEFSEAFCTSPLTMIHFLSTRQYVRSSSLLENLPL